MTPTTLSSHRILFPVADEYEDLEVWYPKLRLESLGARVVLATPDGKRCHGKHGYPLEADAALTDMRSKDFTGIMVPGGWAPDKLRRMQNLLLIIRELDDRGAMLATICHGPWVFISAKVLRGRRMTSTPGIRDDVENAGAIWRDEPVVVDGNLITSRRPPDLPAFGEAMAEYLTRQAVAK
ncbi:MAG: type 1 glutamine amidotransferase domain-containing protein [Myxococcota bacterium]